MCRKFHGVSRKIKQIRSKLRSHVQKGLSALVLATDDLLKFPTPVASFHSQRNSRIFRVMHWLALIPSRLSKMQTFDSMSHPEKHKGRNVSKSKWNAIACKILPVQWKSIFLQLCQSTLQRFQSKCSVVGRNYWRILYPRFQIPGPNFLCSEFFLLQKFI